MLLDVWGYEIYPLIIKLHWIIDSFFYIGDHFYNRCATEIWFYPSAYFCRAAPFISSFYSPLRLILGYCHMVLSSLCTLPLYYFCPSLLLHLPTHPVLLSLVVRWSWHITASHQAVAAGFLGLCPWSLWFNCLSLTLLCSKVQFYPFPLSLELF